MEKNVIIWTVEVKFPTYHVVFKLGLENTLNDEGHIKPPYSTNVYWDY